MSLAWSVAANNTSPEFAAATQGLPLAGSRPAVDASGLEAGVTYLFSVSATNFLGGQAAATA